MRGVFIFGCCNRRKQKSKKQPKLNLDNKRWVLIQRYVTGDIDADGRRQLEKWMARRPENRKIVREVKQVWNLTPPEDFEINAEEAWKKFQKKYTRQETSVPEPIDSLSARRPLSRKTTRRKLYLFRVAAVVVLTLFVGLFVNDYFESSDDTGQVSEFYVMETFETGNGEKARVTFSDGTKVILNSASSLQFPKEFQGSRREVYLEGEAYFEVAHDPEHPFIVYNQDTEIEVLGTEFNVRGWEEDATVEVAVRGGKISVSSVETTGTGDDESIILTEGFFTSVKEGKKPETAQRVNVASRLLWTHGGLYFDNDPFRQVIKDIERRFNVRVTVEASEEDLMDVPYTGTFQYADLDEVLAVVAASMDLEFQRENSEIRFTSNL